MGAKSSNILQCRIGGGAKPTDTLQCGIGGCEVYRYTIGGLRGPTILDVIGVRPWMYDRRTTMRPRDILYKRGLPVDSGWRGLGSKYSG